MRNHPQKIKKQALELASKIGAGPAAKRLKIPYHTIYRWTGGNGTAKKLTVDRTEALSSEISRLKAENLKLKDYLIAQLIG